MKGRRQQCLKAGFHTYEAYGRAAGQGIFLTFDSNSEYTFTAQTQVKLQDRVDSWQTLPKKKNSIAGCQIFQTKVEKHIKVCAV